MKKKVVKPMTIERMLDSIVVHGAKLYRMTLNPATYEVALANIDEDKLREAYNTILHSYNKVYKELRSNSK